MSEVRMGYAWAPGAHISVDPDAIGKELEQIERDGHGLPLEAVVARGVSDATSPLWQHFEHDQKEAAHQYHLSQAGHLVRSIRYRLVNPQTEDERPGERVYQPVRDVTDDRSRPGVYLRVAYTPAPQTPHEPIRLKVTTRQEPPAQFPTAQRAAYVPPMTPEAPALPAPKPASAEPLEMVILKPSQERMRSMLLRLAESMADDPYFDGVVRAIRALP